MKLIQSINIDFISKRYVFFLISILLTVLLIGAFIYKGGPNYGIDFTGGMMMQLSFQQKVDLQDVRDVLDKSDLSSFELQSSEGMVIIRAKQGVESQEAFTKSVTETLQTAFEGNQITVERVEFVGPSVGEYLSKQALYAFLFAFLGMIVYVAFRFKSSLWGVASVIGIIHDVVLTFGFVILVGKEIDITVIAALLTVAGYSINDTIVLFDRMRENLKLIAKEDFGTIINKSINAVLLRTLVTSITVFIVACSLFFLGGEVIHTFAYIMVIGTALGAYSTICLCAPLVYEWETRKQNRLKAARQQGYVRPK